MDLGKAIPLSTGIIMAGIGLIKLLRTKNNMGDKQNDNSYVKEKFCNERNRNIETRLGRGIERFDTIDDELKEQRDILIEVHTIVKGLATK